MTAPVGNNPSTTSAQPLPHNVLPPIIFMKRFANSIKIVTDQIKTSGERSITSVEIGDCITVFLRGFIDGHVDDIIGYHIDNGTTLDNIVEMLNEYGDEENNYEIIIIGGNAGTTQGNNCLLATIRQAIAQQFGARAKVISEYINIAAGPGTKFVSANLQMDGTFTYCFHN